MAFPHAVLGIDTAGLTQLPLVTLLPPGRVAGKDRATWVSLAGVSQVANPVGTGVWVRRVHVPGFLPPYQPPVALACSLGNQERQRLETILSLCAEYTRGDTELGQEGSANAAADGALPLPGNRPPRERGEEENLQEESSSTESAGQEVRRWAVGLCVPDWLLGSAMAWEAAFSSGGRLGKPLPTHAGVAISSAA